MDNYRKERIGPHRQQEHFFPVCQCLPLTSDMVDITARLYAEVFTADEPTTRWHGVVLEEFLPFARRYVQYCATSGLSFIARDNTSGKTIGFIFCTDLTTNLEALGPEMSAFLSHFDATIQLIETLEAQYLNIGIVEPGQILHVYQLGVCRKARGKSVSAVLIQRVLDFARERGYRTIVADCTGPVSRHSFENCGFENAGSLTYADFLFRGIAFFDELEGEISLMVRNI